MNPRLISFSVAQLVFLWLFFGSFVAVLINGTIPGELTADVLNALEFKRSEKIPWPKAGDRGNAEYFIYSLNAEEYAFPEKIEQGTRYRRTSGEDPRVPNRKLIFVAELSIPILFVARLAGYVVSSIIVALIIFSLGRKAVVVSG